MNRAVENYITHFVIFMENIANFHLLTTIVIILLPKSVDVNQNGDVSIVFHLLGINRLSQVHF